MRVSVCVFVCVCVKEMKERKEEGEEGRTVHVDSLINHETDSAVS